MIVKLLFLCVLSVTSLRADQLSDIFYLTFEQEETWNSITVNFISLSGSKPSEVYYDVKSHGGSLKRYAFNQKGQVDELGKIGLRKRFLHRVRLYNLRADTTYYFVVKNVGTDYSREMKFRTLPNDNSRIRVVVGGDLGVKKDLSQVSRLAMAEEPHVILIGGDIAYDNGLAITSGRWINWFSLMKDVMISPKGYLIPLVVAIGNHEVSPYGIYSKKSSFYFSLFPQGRDKKAYFSRKLGNHTILIVLDTGHYHSYKEQVNWLGETLKKHQGLSNRIALYHIPLFPSHHAIEWKKNKGLKYWQPLFDRYKLTLALENHEHTFKRSFPLKGREVAVKGTVYLGDGCWGRTPRSIDANNSRWYLAKVKSVYHVWDLQIGQDSIVGRATGESNMVYDHINIINTSLSTTVQDLSSK